MGNFAFLQIEWPQVLETAHRTEACAHSDARAALAESEALLASLQHRAFSGGL